MFIGHFALGFAARRAAPRVALPVLFGAAQLADLLWPILVALGIEQVRIAPGITAFTPLDFVSYPYSHSLLCLALWGAAFGGIYRSAARHNGRAVGILAALVVSHWILDVLTHRADMPVYPGSARVGLGLWNSIPGTLSIEMVLYAAGVWIYARATAPRDGAGRWGFRLFVVFLVLVYLLSTFGGPPPSVAAVWSTALVGGVLLLAWSWWFDAHRDPEGAQRL
jgi:membrane-bound metal-dependent hydrolase YbcI (DUF457 family)